MEVFMKPIDYWSSKTNKINGNKYEKVLANLNVSHNGNSNINDLISSAYGAEMIRLLELRFSYEQDPMGESVINYYRSIGLQKEMHEADNYYTRWVIITPIRDESSSIAKYPLVIMNHGGGNSIETDEFSTGLHEIAGKEKFMILYLQNTNWQNLERGLNIIEEEYPLDTERVYLAGYSQGGYQATSTIFRMPERITAAAPCGNDIFRDYDNFNIPYTSIEYDNLKKMLIPIIQVNGCCEASSFVPVNDWKPRKDWGYNVSGETFIDPRRDDSMDPTRIIGGRRPFSDMPTPPEGVDKHIWMISRLNKRMDTLNCKPRDPMACISYLSLPRSGTSIDEIHKTLGFYGDEEHISNFFGYKYYFSNIYNSSGLNAFRYIAVENAPHTPPVLMGKLIWDFFKQFRRDKVTKEIVTI
jgi:pimeloyl-ACP methyl ester carboxylesterase